MKKDKWSIIGLIATVVAAVCGIVNAVCGEKKQERIIQQKVDRAVREIRMSQPIDENNEEG